MPSDPDEEWANFDSARFTVGQAALQNVGDSYQRTSATTWGPTPSANTFGASYQSGTTTFTPNPTVITGALPAAGTGALTSSSKHPQARSHIGLDASRELSVAFLGGLELVPGLQLAIKQWPRFGRPSFFFSWKSYPLKWAESAGVRSTFDDKRDVL